MSDSTTPRAEVENHLPWCRSRELEVAGQFAPDKCNCDLRQAEARPPAPEALRELVDQWRTRAYEMSNRGEMLATLRCADRLEALLSAGGGSAPQDEQP